MFEHTKFMSPRCESMFFIANTASLGIEGDMLMMFRATSRTESTSALNSTLVSSGCESRNVRTEAFR